MLRIRKEPSRGVYIGALFYYIRDYALDGLIDAGSTLGSRRSMTAPHSDRARDRVLSPQHQARRGARGQLPEDVRRGHPDRPQVLRRVGREPAPAITKPRPRLPSLEVS